MSPEFSWQTEADERDELISAANTHRDAQIRNNIFHSSRDLGGQLDGKPKNNHNQHLQRQYTNVKDEFHQYNCYNSLRSTKSTNMKQGDFVSKYVNIRYLGLLLFVLASVFCVYKIIDLKDEDGSTSSKVVFKTHLRLLNVFNRHGDRAPSDRPPPGDPVSERIKFYWPNGMSNLTDTGRMRQFRIGLELRLRYEDFLDFDPKSYLAFSSPIYRCVESLEETLKGLFNNEGTLASGYQVIAEFDRLNCTRNRTDLSHLIETSTSNSTCKLDSLPSGSGSPSEWRRIPIDTLTIPVLTHEYLNRCKYRLQNPTFIDQNLLNDKLIRDIKGTRELAELLENKFNISFGFQAISLWSTTANELRLIKTKDSFDVMQPQIGWVNKRLPQYYGASSPITLFDILEQVAVIGYRDRLEIKDTPRIQLGPMIGTMVQSQLNALGRIHEGDKQMASKLFHKNNQLFKNKKMIFYSSHDSILQFLMFRLSLIQLDEKKSFKERFDQMKSYNNNDLHGYLNGLKMSNFGMSLVFSLWEIEMQENRRPRSSSKNSPEQGPTIKRFPVVQAHLYNREDGKYHPVVYGTLELGSACRRLFKQQYPDASVERFYDPEFESKLKAKTMCPFELFLNVTSEYLFTRDKLNDWCN